MSLKRKKLTEIRKPYQYLLACINFLFVLLYHFLFGMLFKYLRKLDYKSFPSILLMLQRDLAHDYFMKNLGNAKHFILDVRYKLEIQVNHYGNKFKLFNKYYCIFTDLLHEVKDWWITATSQVFTPFYLTWQRISIYLLNKLMKLI